MRLFVYGTLRPAHSGLADGVAHLGRATVSGRLYLSAPGSYPYLVVGHGRQVIGNLLEPASGEQLHWDAWWSRVHAVETRAGYELRRAEVATDGDLGVVGAFVWHWPGLVDERLRVANGDWMAQVRNFR